MLHALITVAGLVTLRISATRSPTAKYSVGGFEAWTLMVGTFFSGLAFLLWLFITLRVNPIWAYPISIGLAGILGIFASNIFLKTEFNTVHVLGALIVSFGIFLLSK